MSSLVFYIISLITWIFFLIEVYHFSNLKIYKGAGKWPSIILLFLIGITILLIIQEFSKTKTISSAKEEKLEENLSRTNLILSIGVFLVYIIFLPVTGFVITTGIFVLAMMIILKERRLFIIIPLPFVSSVVMYILFGKLMNIWLPKGIGFFRTISELILFF